MRKLTRNFLVLSRFTSDFSRVFITNRKAEYFLYNSLSLSLSEPYCLAGCGPLAVWTMMSLCLSVELSEIITQIILANIICSRKWWRSCNQPGESRTSPPTPGQPVFYPLGFQEIILLGFSLLPAPASPCRHICHIPRLHNTPVNCNTQYFKYFLSQILKYFDEEVVNTVSSSSGLLQTIFSSDNNGVLNHSRD